MATLITHAAFGAAIGATGGAAIQRKRGQLTALCATLAMLPDVDVLGFAFGIEYASFFGHRGFFHSPFFALGCGAISAALVHSAGRRAAAIVGLAAFAAMVSHGLLDALTTGGEGVMLLYPISTERLFFDWRPIPVSPIGAGFFSTRGLRVLLAEVPWMLVASVTALALARVRRATTE